MKTKRYISTMLVALVFASAGMQAQTARRPQTHDKKQAATTSSGQIRENPARKARSTQPVPKVQAQQVRKVQAQPAHKVRKQQAYPKRTSTPVRKVHTQQVSHNQARHTKVVVPERRSAKVSSAQSIKPDYRRATNKHYAKPRYTAPKHTVKYHNRHYYGGHYYHYAYPTRKVKIHYHHDTYLHHYNVLYYPTYTDIYWNRHMYRNYRKWYPEFYWNYNFGHRIQTISVFDAKYNLGEVAMVYGRVYATWHNKETDDFLLFFGGNFPYQKFTVVLPGHVARKFSWRPQRFFLGEHITTTGLITTFDGSPEIVVKNKRQINLY